MSSSTEEDDEDEIVLPAPMTSRRRSQQGKTPTAPKSRSSQAPSNVKNKSNALTSSGQKSRTAGDKSTAGRDTTFMAASVVGSRSASAAKAISDKEQAQQPKGRRSLVKGTPKKTPTSGAAAIGRLGTPVIQDQVGGTSEGGVGGRSLRASTLVVKKASDIDAKQREQFKHKGRPSAGAISTDV